MRIIDVHGHWGPWPFHLDVGNVALNLELMDRYGIERQIVSAAEAVVYDAVAGNAKLAEVLVGQPRLHGYAVVNANRLERSAEDLRDCLSTGRFVGAKIHTTYPGVGIGSPLMADTFDMLDEVGVPLLLHTWGTDVALLPAMLAKRPGLKVIAGHAGGDAWREAAHAAVECDRIYLEHCRTVTDAGRIGFARSVGVPMAQFLFGTDSTLIDPCISLGVIRDAGFTEGELEQVLSGNADRLFRGFPGNG
ncbi:amidohydrolase family protein [Streptomyces sp. SID13031]|uniref:amidohydrolase family protein n=1 Tax=Streptomyces sp. SID13031 TaxID=2706046 RepID=UPI0013CD8D39|nr:amidohydrolase family protein [Streptomyces sp. SID13031]NEA31650.1 amidohydrolase family protein [Streptomyces sp. SID13031]